MKNNNTHTDWPSVDLTDIWFYYHADDEKDSRHNDSGKFRKTYLINWNTGEKVEGYVAKKMGNTKSWEKEMKPLTDAEFAIDKQTGPYGFVTGLTLVKKEDGSYATNDWSGCRIVDSDCGKSTKKSPSTKKRLVFEEYESMSPKEARQQGLTKEKFNSYSASDAREMVTLIEEMVRNSPPPTDDDDGSLFHNIKGPLKSETLI